MFAKNCELSVLEKSNVVSVRLQSVTKEDELIVGGYNKQHQYIDQIGICRVVRCDKPVYEITVINQIDEEYTIECTDDIKLVCGTNFNKSYTIDYLNNFSVLLDSKGYLCKVINVTQKENVSEVISIRLRNTTDVFVNNILVRLV